MNDHRSEHQPTTVPIKQKKKPWFNQGWIWLIVAVMSIGVIHFGFSDLSEQLIEINDSIENNTLAIQEQSHILTDLTQGIEQLIVVMKDSVDRIIGNA